MLAMSLPIVSIHSWLASIPETPLKSERSTFSSLVWGVFGSCSDEPDGVCEPVVDELGAVLVVGVEVPAASPAVPVALLGAVTLVTELYATLVLPTLSSGPSEVSWTPLTIPVTGLPAVSVPVTCAPSMDVAAPDC